MKKYKFPPMLGPASAQPEGTREWAECLGNELDYRVARAENYGVDDLIPLVKTVVSAKIPPWTIWPEPPCSTVDNYFQLCTGLTYEQLWTLINTYKSDHGLARELDSARAREQAITIPKQGGRPLNKTTHTGNVGLPRRVTQSGNEYLLRRIAREAPHVLEAYEKGVYKSVRAAADAAGIPRLSRAVRLRSEWKHASPEEREEFLVYLEEQLKCGSKQ